MEHVAEQNHDGKSVHPAANLFPLLDGPQFDKLVADIREHGVREPGWLDGEGRILDGRNRARACQAIGIEMPWRTYTGASDNEVAFIVSLNLHRRHLTDDQRAAIAANLANLKQGDNRFTVDRPTGQSINQADAAKALKVSPRRVRRAAAVKKKAPELHEQVKVGKMQLSTATRKITEQKKPKADAIGKTSAPKASSAAAPAAERTGGMTRTVIPKFLAAVEELEKWAEEIEQRTDEVGGTDRQKVVAAVVRADKALRDLATALAPPAA